ncbi:c-type cytochrome [Desmospora profundinema]|uniref:Cytochrome c551 n=1 Tax=Desmospora profundinema TaxID=1571184 RepID=A0ABU1ILG7_9BACL|nr:cytochrome c [Desmospora profundinema]MDR6225578.1 cytochrome c551 [Desmospora profundinema]
MLGSRWKWASILIGSILLLAACVQENPPEGGQQDRSGDAVEQSTAENIYNNNCASCHGQNLEGRTGPDLQQVGGKYSEEEIDDIILNGTGRMPALKQIPDDQRATLAEWLAGQK